jgi:2-polyprenyl-3-methyl-5-hydroxy-6-metoxy-1,4-benzoquinol methylase
MAQDCGFTNLLGVDLSPDQVSLARRACPRAKIVLGNVQEILEQSTSQFGLITGFDLIEHLRKDELLTMLDLVYGALRPGGRLIVQTPNAESPWGMKVRYGDFTHELAVSPQGLHSVLALNGMSEYEARECGPYPHGAMSFCRFLLWKIIHALLAAWNLIETGSKGSGVYTRVFVAAARKPSTVL